MKQLDMKLAIKVNHSSEIGRPAYTHGIGPSRAIVFGSEYVRDLTLRNPSNEETPEYLI